MEVPQLFSLNVSKNGGLIKGGAHKSSKQAPHRRKRLFFSFFSFFSPRVENCQLY
jgi:hypothetical protein